MGWVFFPREWETGLREGMDRKEESDGVREGTVRLKGSLTV